MDSLTILVVEDDPDARRMYGTYFRTKHCRVFEAADGRIGIDCAIELRPDVIVLDLAMPRVDGWTVLAHLRNSSWTADIPVVVVTAVPVRQEEILKLGADACLQKPCTPEELWREIGGLLGPPKQLIH